MLMGSRLRTDLPDDPSTLKPYPSDRDLVAGKEHLFKTNRKQSYNNRHKAKELPTLNRDDPVSVRDLDRPGAVTENLPGKSHIVTTDTGTVRRNRGSLTVMPNSPPSPVTNQSPGDTTAPGPTTGTRLVHQPAHVEHHLGFHIVLNAWVMSGRVVDIKVVNSECYFFELIPF